MGQAKAICGIRGENAGKGRGGGTSCIENNVHSSAWTYDHKPTRLPPRDHRRLGVFSWRPVPSVVVESRFNHYRARFDSTRLR